MTQWLHDPARGAAVRDRRRALAGDAPLALGLGQQHPPRRLEVMRLPSKAAVTFEDWKREWRILVMADVAGQDVVKGLASATKS